MVGATLGGGAFMFLLHPLIRRLLDEDIYNEFFVLLRFVDLLCLPAAGLSMVFARKVAAAQTEDQLKEIRSAARGSAIFLISIWILFSVLTFLFMEPLKATFKISTSTAIWLTITIVLATLFIRIVRGILQGQHNFFAFGWTAIADGFGRFLAIILIGGLIIKSTSGLMAGAAVGVFAAIAIGLWACRDIFSGAKGAIPWKQWLKVVVPLTFGSAMIALMQGGESLVIRACFTEEEFKFYSPGWLVGFALTQFTVPIAAVMFPRIVKQAATAAPSDALKWTFIATLSIGLIACFLSTVIPWLPVRIILPDPTYADSAQLVPYFAWAVLPFTLSNVLLANLFGKDQFKIVPIMMIVVSIFFGALLFQRPTLESMPFLDAFKRILTQLGLTNLTLLLFTAWFSFRK